ncbi:MAG: DinB family protein [Chloroflexota bacterium]|nr:DinB family protein [Chloroflexota bacterium]
MGAEQNNDGLKAFQDWLHRVNQDYVDAHHSDNLDTLITNFNAIRSKTIAFINEHSDEELATPIPDSPWADGTAGGLLLTNAHHDILHMSWLKKGLQGEQAQS